MYIDSMNHRRQQISHSIHYDMPFVFSAVNSAALKTTDLIGFSHIFLWPPGKPGVVYCAAGPPGHSTVTLLARFLGLSTSKPRATLV